MRRYSFYSWNQVSPPAVNFSFIFLSANCCVAMINIWQALELKKLQTPLYEEFYNSLNASCSPNVIDRTRDETTTKYLKLPPKSRSPSRTPVSTASKAIDHAGSPGSNSKSSSIVGNDNDGSQDIPAPPLDEWKGLLVDSQQEPSSPRFVKG